MFSNSLTQEYCAMCDSLLSQILITNPIIHLKKKKKLIIGMMTRIWLNKLSHMTQFHWVEKPLGIFDVALPIEWISCHL